MADNLKRLTLHNSNESGGLASILKNWSSPSLSSVLLMASLQNYIKRLWSLIQQSNPTGLLSGNHTGPGVSGESNSNAPLLALSAWASLTVVSFVGSKLWGMYHYFDPLNTLLSQMWIDSRYSQQVEAHKWLSCIIEQTSKFNNSRDLEGTNFQSVRQKEMETQKSNRWDRYGEPVAPTKVLEIKEQKQVPEVPIYFAPRDIDVFWFFKFNTLFRVTKKAPRSVRRATSINPEYDDYGTPEPAILIRSFSRSKKPLMKFLAWAREEYYAGFKENLYMQVHKFDDYQWNSSPVRMGRGFDTIIIPEETKKKLIDDVQEFLDSQDWYSSRGIPWKRGYMFHGPPGCGKTSTIQALASTFDLPIYIIPVASAGFSDVSLSRAMARLSSKCILVLEDLDALNLKNNHRDTAAEAAAEGGLSSSDTEDEEEGPAFRVNPRVPALLASRKTGRFAKAPGMSNMIEDRLSLSALLNTLDGLDSGEGRIVIASSNHVDSLDSALIRPGRFDCFIHYKRANRTQARDLFLQFYKDYQTKNKPQVPLDEDELMLWRYDAGAEEVKQLAEEWKNMVEEEEFSVASLQGHLIAYKTNPHQAVVEMPAFVAQTRESAKKAKVMLDIGKANDKRIGSSKKKFVHTPRARSFSG